MAKSADPPAGLRAEPFSTWFFFDNPSFGRALRYTFAEKRLGRAVFMNALFLVVALGVLQEVFTRGGFGLISEKLSFGRAAFLTVALVETLAVSLLGPLSFAHVFNAERREDCFDQVVASGCSPVRILLGRFAAALVFLAVVAGSALPFFVLASVVLRGATLEDVAVFYAVLGLYTASICAMTMATCVAVEDAAFPIVLSLTFALVGVLAGLSPAVPGTGGAWSPFRFIIVELAPVARQIGYGELLAPSLFGHVLPVAPVSCVLYVLLFLLAVAYTCIGPDVELSEGLDSFASVTLRRGGEASRGRRGLASTLLRTVQLRFFYENLGPRLRAAGPLLRLGSTSALFVLGHVVTLGTLWPRVAPHAFSELKERTTNPYLAFTALTVGLIALASSGSRAAVLARVPVLSIGSWKVSRFPALFLLLTLALALPPALFYLACRHQGIEVQNEDARRALELHGLIALYAVFMFSVGLVTAMVTTNPYSAMGSALGILFFTNLVPLGWVPLFTSNVVTEESAFVLDVSPIFAALAVSDPDDGVTLTTIRDEQTIQYEHKSSWRPFVIFHAPIALVLLVVGLVLERRDARTRKFLSALALGLILLVPIEARAQEPPSPWRVDLEVGLAGKTVGEGFAPLVATVENPTEKDETVSVLVIEPTTGATLARLGPAPVPRRSKSTLRGLAPAEPIKTSATSLLVQALAGEKTLLAETQARAEVIKGDRLLVVLDSTGALPFAVPVTGLHSPESAPPRRVRGGGSSTPTAAWSTAHFADPHDLPTNPQAWTGAGAVLVNDLVSRPWESAQGRALAGWLGRGGDLILVVGRRAKMLHAKECVLGEALDSELDAVPAVDPRTDVDVGEGEKAAFAAVLQPGERDRVLESDASGAPLVVQRRCGAGRLTLLACDPWQPPYLHDDGTRALLERLLAYGPRYQPRSEALFSELSQLRVQPARIGPAFGMLLLYALIIGPGVYFVLRPRKRGLLAWVAIPALTLVFAAATPLYRLVLARSESAMVTASLIETTAGDPWEAETADALVFSGGLEHHEISVRDRDVSAAIMLPPRGFRGGPPRVGDSVGVPYEGDVFRFGLDVPLWGARYVSLERLIRQNRPRFGRARVLFSRAGTEIELANDGPVALEDVVVVYPSFQGVAKVLLHELTGPLVRGASLRLAADRKPATAWAQGGPTQKDLAQSLERKLVMDRIVRRVEEARDPYQAVLVGHTVDAPPSVNATPQVRLRAEAELIVAGIPFSFVDHVPFGACTVRRDIAPVTTSGPPSILVHVELPPGGGNGSRPSALKLQVVADGPELERSQIAWRGADGVFHSLDLAAADKDLLHPFVVALPLEALGADGRSVDLREVVPPTSGQPVFAGFDLSAEW